MSSLEPGGRLTGTILAIASGERAGTIKTADGSRLPFTATEVVGDFDPLAIGHRVSFEIEHDGAGRRAIRVFHEPVRRTVPSNKPDGGPDLRYGGFLNTANVRVYHFNVLTLGQSVEHSITIDLRLLLKHHVGIQELPGLCATKLAADLKTRPEALTHQLGDDDLCQFTAVRAAAIERKAAAKHSFKIRRGPALNKHAP